MGLDADPVQTWRRDLGAVGFDGDGEPVRVQRINQRGVKLEQRLAAGADDEAMVGRISPRRQRGTGERGGGSELAAAVTVGADEVGVAEAADRRGAISLASGP